MRYLRWLGDHRLTRRSLSQATPIASLLFAPVCPLLIAAYVSPMERPLIHTIELKVPRLYHSLLYAIPLPEGITKVASVPRGTAPAVWALSGLNEATLSEAQEALNTTMKRLKANTLFFRRLPLELFRCLEADKAWKSLFEARYQCSLLPSPHTNASFAVVNTTGATSLLQERENSPRNRVESQGESNSPALKAMENHVAVVSARSFLLTLPGFVSPAVQRMYSKTHGVVVVLQRESSLGLTTLLIDGAAKAIQNAVIAMIKATQTIGETVVSIDISPDVSTLLRQGYIKQLQHQYPSAHLSLAAPYAPGSPELRLMVVVSESHSTSVRARLETLTRSQRTVSLPASPLPDRHVAALERRFECTVLTDLATGLSATSAMVFGEASDAAAAALHQLAQRLGPHGVRLEIPHSYFEALCGPALSALPAFEDAAGVIFETPSATTTVDFTTPEGQPGKYLTVRSASTMAAEKAVALVAKRLESLMACHPRTVFIPSSVAGFFDRPFEAADCVVHREGTKLTLYGTSEGAIAACETSIAAQVALLETNRVQITIPAYMLKCFTRRLTTACDGGAFGVDAYRSEKEKRISLHGISHAVVERVHRAAVQLREQIALATKIISVPLSVVPSLSAAALERTASRTGADIYLGTLSKTGELLVYITEGSEADASLVERAGEWVERKVAADQRLRAYQDHVLRRRYG